MASQTERILEYLHRHRSITAAEAFSNLGVERLAARIADIKQLGFRVDSEMVSGKNRYGQPVHFKRYFLRGESNAKG